MRLLIVDCAGVCVPTLGLPLKGRSGGLKQFWPTPAGTLVQKRELTTTATGQDKVTRMSERTRMRHAQKPSRTFRSKRQASHSLGTTATNGLLISVRNSKSSNLQQAVVHTPFAWLWCCKATVQWLHATQNKVNDCGSRAKIKQNKQHSFREGIAVPALRFFSLFVAKKVSLIQS